MSKGEGINRRNFLARLTGGLATGSEWMNRGIAASGVAWLVGEAIKEDGLRRERQEALSAAPTFHEHVLEDVNAYRRPQAEVPASQQREYPVPSSRLADALTNGDKPALGDWGRSRIQYVRDELMHGSAVESIPENVRREFADMMSVGLAGEESGFHNGLESSSGAQMILQMIPGTYSRYGKTEEEMQYLEHQVDAANQHLAFIYGKLRSEAGPALDRIRDEYYGGDQVEFDKRFMPLILADAYHAGEGFTIMYLNMFAEGELSIGPGARSYDVFQTLADNAAESDRVVIGDTKYGRLSSRYASRVFAANLLIRGLRS